MPYYRVPGVGLVHLNLGGKLRKNPPAPCCAMVPMSTFGASFEGRKEEVCCRAISTCFCDWPTEDGTCDAPLCPEHATETAPGHHLCPGHLRAYRERTPELF